MNLLTFLLATLAPLLPAPQSPQAWDYAVTQGSRFVGTVYHKTARGLVCAKSSQFEVVYTLENVAAQKGWHPSRLAEEIIVYLWDDWTLLCVSNYDARTVLKRTDARPLLKSFLERFYKEHHICLLGILRMLTFGYEKTTSSSTAATCGLGRRSATATSRWRSSLSFSQARGSLSR